MEYFEGVSDELWLSEEEMEWMKAVSVNNKEIDETITELLEHFRKWWLLH